MCSILVTDPKQCNFFSENCFISWPLYFHVVFQVLLRSCHDPSTRAQLINSYDMLLNPEKMGHRFQFFSVLGRGRLAQSHGSQKNSTPVPVAGFTELTTQWKVIHVFWITTQRDVDLGLQMYIGLHSFFIVSSTFLPLCLKSPPIPTFTVLYFSPLKEWIKTCEQNQRLHPRTCQSHTLSRPSHFR